MIIHYSDVMSIGFLMTSLLMVFGLRRKDSMSENDFKCFNLKKKKMISHLPIKYNEICINACKTKLFVCKTNLFFINFREF